MDNLIVDRIAGDTAVLEGGGGLLHLPARWLPSGANEGSVLRLELERDGDAARITLTLDPEARAEREAEIRRLRASIPRGPSGDLAL